MGNGLLALACKPLFFLVGIVYSYLLRKYCLLEKIEKYQDIILDYLNTYAKKSKLANMPDIENKVLADKEKHSYQLMRIGWQGAQFVFSVVFYFDIIDGKVWFQRNITEREVVDVLIEKGIPKEDIVFGFHPPYVRPHTGFATA